MVADETLEKVVHQLPPLLQKDLEDNLCVCNEVPKRKVIEAIIEGAHSVEEVRQQCYATDGNGCCKRQVERLVDLITEIKK
jgi:bacterioferritin-associated ferredoxin